MKATELMIADWVMQFGEPARIVGIRIDNGIYFRTNIHDTWYESGVDGIEPIPLTPEILEKNGFDKWEDDGGVPLWSLDKKEVRYCMTFEVIDGGCPVLTIEDVVDGDSRHTSIVLKDEVYNVHDLQHVLCFLGLEIQIII